MRPEEWYIASQDNFFGPLRRRPHVAVANNTNILNDTTVLTLRYGFSTWQDACDKQPFSAGVGSLGFSPTYTNALSQTDVFPELNFDDVADVGGWGAIPNRWDSPYTINATLSKLWGNHSFKVGGDMRKMGVSTVSDTEMGGSFTFDRRFTSLNGVGGHELASVLLGAASSGSVPFNDGPFEWFTKYYGAYIQDDWRVNSEAHGELRRAPRARRWPEGDREPPGGGLRSRGGQSAECDRAEDRAARRPHHQRRPHLRRRGRRARKSRATRRRSRSRRAAASAIRSTRRRSCAAATACSTRRGTTPEVSTARPASRAGRR